MHGSPLTYLPHISNKAPGVSQAKKRGGNATQKRNSNHPMRWVKYEMNTVEHTQSFSIVGLGGGGGELEEFLKEWYYLSPRSMFIIENVL